MAFSRAIGHLAGALTAIQAAYRLILVYPFTS